MKRLVLLFALVAVCGLSGCGGRVVYKNPDRSAAQEEKDYYDCRFEAEKSTGNLSNKENRDDRIQTMIDSCMRARGYKQ